MATTLLRFWFDFSSPFAYLGSTQVTPLAERHGAELEWRPFLLGGLFRDIGTPDVPLFTMPAAKQRHVGLDLARWADHWGVPLRFPTRFPMNTVKALRMVLQLEATQRAQLAKGIFHAYWADDRDLGDDATLRAIADGCGLDGAALVAATRDEDCKRRLRQATDEARGAGVCGAPCFVVRTRHGDRTTELLFWGQDRMELVERALQGWPGGRGDLAENT